MCFCAGYWPVPGVRNCIALADLHLSLHCMFMQDDPEDFVEEQGLMGRVVNLFQAEEADDQYLVSHVSFFSFCKVFGLQMESHALTEHLVL